MKVALGAYLFSFLQVIGIPFQGIWPYVPAQVFQVAPFPMMIFALVLMHMAQKGSELTAARSPTWLRRMVALLSGNAPASLGKPFRPE